MVFRGPIFSLPKWTAFVRISLEKIVNRTLTSILGNNSKKLNRIAKKRKLEII